MSKYRRFVIVCIALVCIISALVMVLTYRTPRSVFFGEISEAKIPKGFTVIMDKYEDGGFLPDYSVSYTIDFNNLAARKYIKNIKESELYCTKKHNKYNATSIVPDSIIKQGIWTPSFHGFQFEQEVSRTHYNIEFDTTTNRASFTANCCY